MAFGNVHGERAIRESGAGKGAYLSKMTSATLAKSFDGFFGDNSETSVKSDR